MADDIKKWVVEYDHKDGRSGTAKVTTEVEESGAFRYGNGKCGALSVSGATQVYDLRYAKGDLHQVMLREYFGAGLVKATEQ